MQQVILLAFDSDNIVIMLIQKLITKATSTLTSDNGKTKYQNK